MLALENFAERKPEKRAKNPRPFVAVIEIDCFQRDSIAKSRRKFIDPTKQLTQHPVEMFVKPTKPMIAIAAPTRVAWHVIVLRRDF